MSGREKTAAEGRRGLFRLLFPPRCICCGAILGVGADAPYFCSRCRGEWQTVNRLTCPQCGYTDDVCHCRPGVDAAVVKRYLHVIGYERGAVSSFLFGMKRRRHSAAVEYAAQQMSAVLKAEMDQTGWRGRFFLVPVPVGADSRLRGTDHTGEIAKKIAKELGIPVWCPLRRMRGSKKQKTLNRQERIENAERSYRLKNKITPPVIDGCAVLIDDVMTSGATTASCARLLAKAGAKEVWVLTFAKTHRT